MIALAIAIGIAAALASVSWFAVVEYGVSRADRYETERTIAKLKHRQFEASLELDRDRFEATKPVPPHEDVVRRLGLLETKVDAMMARAGFEVMRG